MSNFCSGMPLGKVHELAFLWFGLPGSLLIGETKTLGVFPPFLALAITAFGDSEG